MKHRALWLSVSALALVWGGGAAAQTTSSASKDDAGKVHEVVITAERRTSNLQTTPISATVISGGELVKKGVVTIDSIQFVAPGITVNNFGQGNDFNIRGIGKAEHNSQTGVGVIVYRDGIATFPGYFQEEPYYDIGSVEILRGPQGTFVGQNATGGAVFITSNNPVINGGNHGYIAGQVGNYDDVATQGAINLPISDTFAARVAFNAEGRNSFYTVTGPNHGNPGNLREGSARLSLLWKPTDALTVLFKTDYNYIDMGAIPSDPYNATNSPFKVTANFPGGALDKWVRSDLKIDYVMPGGITLRSISGYQRGNTFYHTDLDGTSAGNLTFGDKVDEAVYSQEFNLISPNTGPITWVIGGYYQSDEYKFPAGQFFIGVPPPVYYTLQGTNPEQTSAAFGQVSFALPDNFQLQVGARYSNSKTTNHVTINQYGLPLVDEQSADSNSVTGKVALNWTINAHNFVYGFVATGDRAGGLNLPVGLGLPAPFKPEKVTEYELGWKAGMLDGHLRTQIDAYYNDYRNFQVIIGYPAFPTFGFELNAPNPTKMYGFELQAEGVFGDFSFDAGLGLLHSQLGTFYAVDPRAPITSVAACDPANGPALAAHCIALGGKQQTYAPNFTFNLGGQYVFRLADGDTVTPRLNYGHVSDQWATLFESAALGDHLGQRNIFNGQIAWSHGDLVATLYGTNLTDQHYVGALNSGLRFEGPPRQYGVRLLKLF